VRALQIRTLYPANNPTYLGAIDSLRAAFGALWNHTDEVTLTVAEKTFVWEDRVIHTDSAKLGDGLAWFFFKDGVREIVFQRGFEVTECAGLLDVLVRARKSTAEDDDLLTMLWERDFHFFQYRYVEITVAEEPEDVAPEKPVDGEKPPAGEDLVQDGASAGVVNMEEYDASMYFLEDEEFAQLRSELNASYAGDLRLSVIALLLDTFEQQREAETRDSICNSLDAMILHLVSSGEFRTAAFLLREAGVAARRAVDLAMAHRNRLGALSERLSSPATVSQLIQWLDQAQDLPPQDQLGELFEQLRAPALETLLSWLPKTTKPEVRTLLESACDRLAAHHGGELVRLVGSTNRFVCLEAIRRSAALKGPAAFGPLAKVMADGDAEFRLAAAETLAVMGTAGALQLLEKAIDDPERDVRLVALKALAAKNYYSAVGRVENIVFGKSGKDMEVAEKLAYFEAYAALAGEAGVAKLDVMLNGRDFIGRKEDSNMRGCAALALGKIATPNALTALQKAAADKDPVVRSAVAKSLAAKPAAS
jgi:hypothetical protein